MQIPANDITSSLNIVCLLLINQCKHGHTMKDNGSYYVNIVTVSMLIWAFCSKHRRIKVQPHGSRLLVFHTSVPPVITVTWWT